MKRIEWLIVLLLIIIGLSCLTMSATSMMNPDSIRDYLTTLLKICLWTAIPAVAGGILYLVIKRKKRD
jgi:hypothetical protein